MSFDIYNNDRDRSATMIKLTQLGYKFEQFTQYGKKMWRVLEPNQVNDGQENERVEVLIARIVEDLCGK